MTDSKKFDILFLVDGGVGNLLEALYAVEYCIANNKRTGVYIHSLNRSFVEFLRSGYGSGVILDSLEGVTTGNLIHSFTYVEDIRVPFVNYFYVKPDSLSSQVLSETEQYLSVVKALYPSDFKKNRLEFLPEDYSEKVKAIEPGNKIILYPGCSKGASSKRWPYFMDLMNKIGEQHTIILGSREDLDFQYSYYYPSWISKFPQMILNRREFYDLCKRFRLLKPHAHFDQMAQLKNAYFNQFSWEELVAIFNRCKYFIGNDGGLMHLAACCGTSGKAIFGPSSVEKNKAFNPLMKTVHTQYECQPCSLGNKGIAFNDSMITCPHQLRCQYNLTVDLIQKDIPVNN